MIFYLNKCILLLINDVYVVGEGQSHHVVVKVAVVHGFLEQELSCLLSSLSALTEPSEVIPVTDTRDPNDSSDSCDRRAIR